MLLKVDCLPNAVGKQPSIPLIYFGIICYAAAAAAAAANVDAAL